MSVSYASVHLTMGKIVALASSVLPGVDNQIIDVNDGSKNGTRVYPASREWAAADFQARAESHANCRSMPQSVSRSIQVHHALARTMYQKSRR